MQSCVFGNLSRLLYETPVVAVGDVAMSAAQRDKGAPAKVCANCGRTGSLGYRVNRNGVTVCTRADVCRRRQSNAATPRLDEADYAARLEAQGGGCALCGTKPKTRRLDADHDHRTGEVRGLLCHRCNRALPTWVTPTWLLMAFAYLLTDAAGNTALPNLYRAYVVILRGWLEESVSRGAP